MLCRPWQGTLVSQAFTSCLPYQHAPGKRTDPALSPKAYGHSALAEMIRMYADLVPTWEDGKGYGLGLKASGDAEQ